MPPAPMMVTFLPYRDRPAGEPQLDARIRCGSLRSRARIRQRACSATGWAKDPCKQSEDVPAVSHGATSRADQIGHSEFHASPTLALVHTFRLCFLITSAKLLIPACGSWTHPMFGYCSRRSPSLPAAGLPAISSQMSPLVSSFASLLICTLGRAAWISAVKCDALALSLGTMAMGPTAGISSDGTGRMGAPTARCCLGAALVIALPPLTLEETQVPTKCLLLSYQAVNHSRLESLCESCLVKACCFVRRQQYSSTGAFGPF